MKRRPVSESDGLKLLEVALLMAHVVLDQELEGYRRVITDYAARLKPFFGDPIDGGHQDFVLRMPPAAASVSQDSPLYPCAATQASCA